MFQIAPWTVVSKAKNKFMSNFYQDDDNLEPDWKNSWKLILLMALVAGLLWWFGLGIFNNN